jgi:hypothetical protein
MSPEGDWKGRKEELLLVNAAVDRELDDYTKRDSAMQARATLIIGAASVVGVIQLGDGLSGWAVVNVVLSLLAALAGVVVVFPHTGDRFNPRKMRNEFYAGKGEDEVLHHIVETKLEILADDEKSLRFRGRFARVGFVLLILGTAAAVVGVLTSPPEAERAPSDAPSAVVYVAD